MPCYHSAYHYIEHIVHLKASKSLTSDKSLGIKRDLEGNVTETALDWEEL